MSDLEYEDDALSECILAARFPCALPGDVVRALAAARGDLEVAAAALIQANETPAAESSRVWLPKLLGPAPGRRPLPAIQPDAKRQKVFESDPAGQESIVAAAIEEVDDRPEADDGEQEEEEDVVIRRILARQREVRELEREHAAAEDAKRAARRTKLAEKEQVKKKKKKKMPTDVSSAKTPKETVKKKNSPPKRLSGRKRLRGPARPSSSDTEDGDDASAEEVVAEAQAGEEDEPSHADDETESEESLSDGDEEMEEEAQPEAEPEPTLPQPIDRSVDQRARCASVDMFTNPRVAAVRRTWKSADLVWVRVCQPVLAVKTPADGAADSDSGLDDGGAPRSTTKKRKSAKKRGKGTAVEQANRYVQFEIQEFVQNRQTGQWYVDLQMRDSRHLWLGQEQLFRVNIDDVTLLWLQPLPPVVLDPSSTKNRRSKAEKPKPILAPLACEQYHYESHRAEMEGLDPGYENGSVLMKMTVSAKSSWNRSTIDRAKKNSDVLPEQVDALAAAAKQWCVDHPEDRKMTKAKLGEKLRTTVPAFLNDVPNLFLMSPYEEQQALRAMCRDVSPGAVVKVAFPSLAAKSKQVLLCVVEGVDLKHGVTLRPWELLGAIRIHWADWKHRVAFVQSDPFADDTLLDFRVVRMDAARVSLFDTIIKSDMLEFFRPPAPLVTRSRIVDVSDANDVSQPGAPAIDDDAAAPDAGDAATREADDLTRGVQDGDVVLTLNLHVASRVSYADMAARSSGCDVPVRLSAIMAIRVDGDASRVVAAPTGGTSAALTEPLLHCFRGTGKSTATASMLPLFLRNADERAFRKDFHASPSSVTIASLLKQRDVHLFLMPLRVEYCRRFNREHGVDASAEFDAFVAARQRAFNKARRELRAAKINAPGVEFQKNLRTVKRKGHAMVYFCDPVGAASPVLGVHADTPIAFNPDAEDREAGAHRVYNPYTPGGTLPSMECLQGVASFPSEALRDLPTYEELRAACPGEIDAYDDADRDAEDSAATSAELLPAIATVAAGAASTATIAGSATQPAAASAAAPSVGASVHRGRSLLRCKEYQPLYLCPAEMAEKKGRQPVGRSALLPVPGGRNPLCARCSTTMHSKMDGELFAAKYPTHAHLCPVLFLSPYYFYCMRIAVPFRQLRSGMFTPVLSRLFPPLANPIRQVATRETPDFPLETKDLLQRSAEHWHSVDWHSEAFEARWSPTLQAILAGTTAAPLLSKKTGRKLKPAALASTPGDSDLVRRFQEVFHRAGVASSVLVRDYQVQAVCWMLEQESALARGCAPEQSVSADVTSLYAPFVTRLELPHPRAGPLHLWYSSFTNTWLPRAPPLVCGGVLGDHMGIGKTVEVLAAIALDRQLLKHGMLTSDADRCLAKLTAKSNAKKTQTPRDKFGFVLSDATLIVAPLSVSTQWMKEISKRAPGLRALYFHTSTTRGVDLGDEAIVGGDAYDIVVVPSSTLGTSFSAAEKVRTQLLRTAPWEFDFSSPVRYLSVLHRIRFRRLVVDESHKDRTGTSQVACAIHSLPVPRRFKVSGTPLGDTLAHFRPHLTEMGLDSYAFGPSFWRAVDFATSGKLPSISNHAALSNHDRLQPLPSRRSGQMQPAASVASRFRPSSSPPSSFSPLSDVDASSSSASDSDESDDDAEPKPSPPCKAKAKVVDDDDVMILEREVGVFDVDAPIPPLMAMRNMLDLLLKNVLLRRKGGMPYRGRPKLLELTGLRQHVIRVEMSPQQAAIYNLRLDAARHLFETFEARGELGVRTIVLKRCLERVEVYCSYASIPDAATAFAEFLEAVAARLAEKEERLKRLKRREEHDAEIDKLLRGVESAADHSRPRAKGKCMSESDECAVCIELYEDPVQLLHCNHMFCSECLVDILSLMADAGGYAECPLCRGKYCRDDFCAPYVEEAPAESAAGSSPETAMEVDSVGGDEGRKGGAIAGDSAPLTMDAKLNALIRYLEGVQAEDPGAKAVIFTQYRECLAPIRRALEEAGIGVCHIDGSMPPSRRSAQMDRFDGDPDARAMVLSARTSADGLTLTAASRLVMFDPIASPTKAAQAIKRIWRFGQVKNVEICWLLMKDTIEIAKHRKCQGRIVDCLEDEAVDDSADEADAPTPIASKAKTVPGSGCGGVILDVRELFFMKPLDLPTPNPFVTSTPPGGPEAADAPASAEMMMSDA
jgi:SNF2 family DNA or RNA helicase